MSNTSIFDEPVGLLKRGAIHSYDAVRHIINVKLNTSSSTGTSTLVSVPSPQGIFYNNGIFIGTKPVPGTPVVVGQGSGGQYYFVSYLVENTPALPPIKKDELLLRTNDDTKVTLDLNNNINIGSDEVRTHYSTKYKYYSSNFKEQFYFTQASRNIDGLIRRDLKINNNFDSDTKLENDNYHSKMFVIPMDPTVTYNPSISGDNKNPGRVESREITYEFQYDSSIEDDLSESTIYLSNNDVGKEFSFPNRRKSRADAFSLSLVSPNYLFETIKGTGVDIFGNILDLNRRPIPIGKDSATIQTEKNLDKSKSFLEIRALERRALAYHFELNARKDLYENGLVELPDINSNEDYSRKRSRLFIDIDKEGQFKINIPASSETGNVSLLTRYENYSTVGPEDDGNPNKIIFREDNLDILHDSFAAPRATPNDSGFSYSNGRGSIFIKDNDRVITPIDRITGEHIKYGSPFHDILNTCFVHQNNDFLNYQNGSVIPLTVNLNDIPELTDLFVPEIKVSGEDANAGGRSGSLTLDGSLDFNIGANTSDRQSLLLDTAGGMVWNIGRDLRNRSLMASMNGDVMMQIGGFGVVGDKRFVKQHNGNIGAVLDLRVMTSGGYTHMIRLDDNGVTIMTPGHLKMHSKGDLKISSDGNIDIQAETVQIQERQVIKAFGGSI